MEERGESSSSLVRVELNESDIPGADLSGAQENHTVPELHWTNLWLVSRAHKESMHVPVSNAIRH